MESRSKNQKTTLYLPLELIFIFSLGVTGENIVVAILDDGLDMDSDDLKDNFASISTEKKTTDETRSRLTMVAFQVRRGFLRF